MKSVALIASLIAIASSLPIRTTKREVPQEHSHNGILATVRTTLQQNNPDQIVDVVFGLLGNAAASQGQGKITDTDCLQQAIADQAFTNAKAAGDVDGQVAALQFRALERNTGKVGLASVACTAIKAKNPEIAAIQQHQDPASANAAAVNKAIVLELAKQIAAVGGDPTLALKTGTFAPGDVNDPTGKGNTCDEDEAGEGCIFSQNLLVEDATVDEINAAVAGVAGPGNAGAVVAAPPASTSIVPSSTGTACSLVTVTMTMTVGTEETSAPASSPTEAPADPTTTSETTAAATPTPPPSPPSGDNSNLQTFKGALGGILPPAVTAGGKGFVTDNSEFVNLSAALGRSCDVQHNQCANKANSGGQSFTVGDCDNQDTQCKQEGGAP